jgi:hypothetical protein
VSFCELPACLAPYIASAPLTLLRKSDGRFRPIAVGEAERRLTSKLAMQGVRDDATKYLSPHQVGVGVANGAEAILHAVDFLINSDWSSDMYVLQLDFENAFNLVNRETMFAEVREHCPSIAAWVEYCYKAPAVLYLQQHSLFSSCGVQQGDPLGPLNFSLPLQKFILRIKELCPNLHLNVWYLDDGTLIGKKADLLKVLQLAQTEGPAYGLILNLPKSMAWTPCLMQI